MLAKDTIFQLIYRERERCKITFSCDISGKRVPHDKILLQEKSKILNFKIIKNYNNKLCMLVRGMRPFSPKQDNYHQNYHSGTQ